MILSNTIEDFINILKGGKKYYNNEILKGGKKYYKDKKNFDEAIGKFKKVLEGLKKSDNYAQFLLYNYIGISLIASEKYKNYEEASHYFIKAIKKQNEFSFTFVHEGFPFFCNGCALFLREKYKVIDKYEDIDEEVTKNLEKSIENFDNAIERDWGKFFVWYYKGYANFLLKKYQIAIECFDNALKINPNWQDSWFIKGLTHYLIKENEKAIDCLDKAKKLCESETNRNGGNACTSSADILHLMGHCYLKLANKNNEKVPEFSSSLFVHRLRYYYEEYSNNALDSFEKAYKKYKDIEGASYKKSEDKSKNDEDEKARETKEKDRETKAQMALVLLHIGYVYGNLGLYKESINYFKAALEIFEEITSGKIKEKYEVDIYEVDIANKIKEKYEVDIANIRRTLGFVYSKVDEYEEAECCFKEALQSLERTYDNTKRQRKKEEKDKMIGLILNSWGYFTISHIEKLSKGLINKNDKISEAISNFNQAIKYYNGLSDESEKKTLSDVDSEYLSYFYDNKGSAYILLDKYEVAINYFDDALKYKNNYAESLYNKGYAYYKLEKYTEAIRWFEKAIENPTTVKDDLTLAYASYHKGLALIKQQQYEKYESYEKYEDALESFDKAIQMMEDLELKEQLVSAWFGRGDVLNLLKRYSEARDFFSKCIDYCKNSKDDNIYNYFRYFLILRGQSKYNLEDIEGAKEDLESVSDEDFKTEDEKKLLGLKYNALGQCYYKDNKYEKAETMFKKAISKYPNLIDAHYNLAILYNTTNKENKLEDELDKCIRINDTSSQNLNDTSSGNIIKKYAIDAKNKLKNRGQLDSHNWYRWWFNGGLIKKVLGFIIIIAIVLLPLVIIVNGTFFSNINSTAFNNTNSTAFVEIIKSQTTERTTLLSVFIIILAVMLLLPNLRKIKIGTIEMETLPYSSTGRVDLYQPIQAVTLRPNAILYQPPDFRIALEYDRAISIGVTNYFEHKLPELKFSDWEEEIIISALSPT